MKCPQCQHKLRDAARFCDNCGLPTSLLEASTLHEPVAAIADPLIGQVLDSKYEFIMKLGEGGMGAVYRARRIHLAGEVAIKVLHKKYVVEDGAVERFRREARAASQLNHPNVVTIHDFGESRGDDAPVYIVMELVEGESLRDLLRREGKLKPDRAVALMRDICAGVGAAHRRNIIHRDLKPDNVIILPPNEDREREFAKVVDFGLAKLRDIAAGNTLTRTGALIGTPYYMSPEQCRGESLDARADVYSLGGMLYEMLAGAPPFNATNLADLVAKHLHEEPPLLPEHLDVARELEAVCSRALSKDRSVRQADATELSRTLRDAEEAAAARRAAEEMRRLKEEEERRRREKEALRAEGERRTREEEERRAGGRQAEVSGASVITLYAENERPRPEEGSNGRAGVGLIESIRRWIDGENEGIIESVRRWVEGRDDGIDTDRPGENSTPSTPARIGSRWRVTRSPWLAGGVAGAVAISIVAVVAADYFNSNVSKPGGATTTQPPPSPSSKPLTTGHSESFFRIKRAVDNAPVSEAARMDAEAGGRPLNSSDPEFLYLYGRALMLGGREGTALQAFNAALQKLPTVAPSHNPLTTDLLCAKAAAALRGRNLDEARNAARSINNYGKAYQASFEARVGEMRDEVNGKPLDSLDPEFLYNYGNALLISGDPAGAARAFRTAVERTQENMTPGNASIRLDSMIALTAALITSEDFNAARASARALDEMIRPGS